MKHDPTEMERRCLEAANLLRGPGALATVRAIIRELRIPTPEMISAMNAAMWNSGLKRGGHVTTTLKHQLRWAVGIDAASPAKE